MSTRQAQDPTDSGRPSSLRSRTAHPRPAVTVRLAILTFLATLVVSASYPVTAHTATKTDDPNGGDAKAEATGDPATAPGESPIAENTDAVPEPTVPEVPDRDADRVTFRLGPASGTSFTQVLFTQRDRSMKGVGKEEARAIGRTRYSVQKTDDGWTYTGRLLSSETTRDGKPFDDPYGLVLTDVSVNLDVADDGTVRRVRGYDGLTDRVRVLLSAEIAAKLEPFIGPKALTERAITDWRGRIGDFVGLTVSIGDTRTERLSYEIPGGVELEYVVETTFAGWRACPAGQCLRIETRYDSAEPTADGDVGPSRIAGSSTRLLDPSTMLIYSEEEERTVWATLQIEGLGPTPLIEVATMTYSYEYDQRQ
jgi:hypothetical protein